MYFLSLECGMLLLCGNVTPEEVCFVDIPVVFPHLEERFVKLVCFDPCKLFLLLIPLCRPLVIWWCIEVSRIFAKSLDYVQKWKFVSECCSFHPLVRESDAHLF